MRKKICIITGTRADYGILHPIMHTLKRSKYLKLYVIATCMHLMKEFGYTLKEIEKDGFNIYQKINIFYKQDTGQAMAFSIGKAVSSFSKSFSKLKPDIVVILGDRGEVLAAAIAANYMNIPVAHIHGGEVSGHVDGTLRHAVTKLSHIHFPATKKAKERIIKLGEEAWRIFVVGAPALDRIANQFAKEEELLKKYKIDRNKSLAILLQHPVSTQIDKAKKQIINTLKAITKLRLQTIIIYPNADAGGRCMIGEIKKFKKYPFLKQYKSIPHRDYLGLMKIASVLIGNSSSAIIEAPTFKLPVVNIGNRQYGRERSSNIIDTSYDEKEIIKAINKALNNKSFLATVKRCRNPYGDGHASERIAKVLQNIRLGKQLLEKKITY